MGLECTSGPIAPICQGETDAGAAAVQVSLPADGGRSCGYNPFSTAQRNALIEGFGAGELDMTYDPDNGQATVSPPSDARVVACALFACLPSFTSATNDNLTVHAIANFDDCALVFDKLVPPRLVFAVRDNPNLNPVDCDAAPASAACPGAVLNRLLLGCWAYDATSVFLASRLEPVNPRTTYLFGRAVDDCTSDNATSCPVAGSTRLGTCFQGTCMPHCQTPQDCQEQLFADAAVSFDAGTADAVEGGPPPLPPCGFACVPATPRRDIGVCEPVGGDP